MSYSLRNYRHRNPKSGDEQKSSGGPFFQSQKGTALQRKKGSAFFQAQQKDGDTVQRLATSKEDEKLGTHDARMEKDKEEPMKPVQKKHKPDEKKEKDKKHLKKAEDPKKKKKKKPGEGKVQKKEEHTAHPAVAAELEQRSGQGSTLPAETLAEMNKSFGMDFSHVRIHHDAAAAALCSELNAQAFTHGHDIYFNEGKYNPESGEGKRLLAHELTHVAQQNC